MREMFYRRDNKGGGGYKVVAKEASIPAKDESFGSQKALPVSAGEIPLLTYKQCCTDEGTLMVSCGYIDPYGNRGSGLTHVLLTESAAERTALLEAYPSGSGYFQSIREAYSRADAPLELESKALNIPLETYLGEGGGGIAAAADLLKDTFGTRELLCQVFSALLDSASANPRMVAVALTGDAIDALPEHGRRIAEALFAFLPEPVVARLGYLCPALNLSDAAFALRFVNNPAIAKSSMVYLVDPAQGTISKPTGAPTEPGDYVEALVDAILSGDDGALQSMRQLRRELSDWSIFGSKTVRQDIDIRYAMIMRPENLTRQETKLILDWWHSTVVAASKKREAQFDGYTMWGPVCRWIETYLAPQLWARQSEWKAGNEPYDPRIIRLMFEDGQTLHELGRPEAAFFRDLMGRHLEKGTLAPPADRVKLRGELLSFFCTVADHADDGPYVQRQLYWPVVEPCIRREWAEGALARDKAVNAAVRKMYRLNPDMAAPYFDAYVAQLVKNRPALCVGDGSEFHRDAVARMIRDHRDAFADCMDKELNRQDSFQSPQTMLVHHWYLDRVKGDAQLEKALKSSARKKLDRTLSALGKKDVEALLGELSGMSTLGIAAEVSKLLDPAEVKAALERRVVELTRQDGIYSYWPDKPEVARQVAEVLDRAKGAAASGWGNKLKNLEKVQAIKPEEASEAEFTAYARMANGFDDKQKKLARATLWTAMQKAFGDSKQPIGEPLIWSLAMKSYDRGEFSPQEMCSDAEKLGVTARQLKRFCAKPADEEAKAGLGYLAYELRAQLDDPAKGGRNAYRSYPRQERRAIKTERVDEEREGSPSGLPTPLLLAGTALFGGGLAGSALGLLRMLGLM